MSKARKTISEAWRIVFSLRDYRRYTIIGFFALLVMYAFILPATFTGGRIGIVSIRFLTPKLALFAFLFSALLSVGLAFAAYSLKKHPIKLTTSSPGGRSGSFFGSILPPLLCCSPILPSMAAMIGGVFPFAFGISGFVQGFIATYETQIFSVIVLFLMYSLYKNAGQVVLAEQGICRI